METHSFNRKIDIISQPLPAISPCVARNSMGKSKDIFLVREQPLTIYLNRQEIVTVMTMGSEPHYLVAGFLLNQHLIEDEKDIKSIHIDWSVNAAAVYADSSSKAQQATDKRIITSGCGQGTMFAGVIEATTQRAKTLSNVATLTAKDIYHLLSQLSSENEVYKKAGGVHSCALCTRESVIKTVEDVGRHNAVDSLTGFIALHKEKLSPTILYTTGRLTSEMVIKTVQMGLPIVVSRSGATSMGVEIAEQCGITLISRAKGKSFLVLSGSHRIKETIE